MSISRLLPSTRVTTVLAITTVIALCLCARAGAASYDPSGFHFVSSSLYVNEDAGHAVVTVERSATKREAQVRFIAIGVTAEAPYDYVPVKSMLDFLPGQASATFDVPIIDHGINGLAKTIQLSLFGPSPIGLGSPSKTTLTILNNDPMLVRDFTNPLDLPATPAASDPLAGARFFVDHQDIPAVYSRQYPALKVIAREPETQRFGNFSGPDVGVAVSRFLARATTQEPGTVPMISTYRLVDGSCGHWSEPPASVAAYHNFIESFAQGIGDYRAVLFLEMDSLITVGCLSPHGLTVRMQELHDAITILTTHCPRLVIYLDAGAGDAVPAPETARLLRRAGVSMIQGFFVNSTHFDWTSKEIRYGDQVSRLTGGKHFVVNTAENGRGPLVPASRVKSGNEVLCNPPGRGLGPLPTADTGYRNVDAFAWIGYPGNSGGACRPGAPPTGFFWPALALQLVQLADFHVT